MGCAASSVVQTARFYDAWPPKVKEQKVEGKRKWFSQMPYDADDDFINDCMEEHRALTHLHASSSAAYEGQRTAHHRKQGSGSVQCSSAWLSRAGEDFGVRKVNQDSALAVGSYSIGDALFGVFDGHGPHGHLVSQHIRNQMPDILRRHLKQCDSREALIAAFQDMQQSLERTSFNTEVSGSTCTLAHLTGQRLAVGWVGDSRAVLGRAQQDGSCLAVPLTQDHKPSDDRERARILAMQGRVERIQTETGEEVGPSRVWLSDAWVPGLAMSRALGDGMARRVGVISEAEVCLVDLEEGDQFLILASDGVWEFMSNQEAVDTVSACSDDEVACSKLVAAAYKKWMEQENGCADDITAVIEEVSNQLSAAVDNQHGSGIVISLAGDSNYLNPKNWTANLDVPVIKARATALEKGLNAILEPLLAEVEDILTQDHTGEECSNAPKEEEDTGIISWRTASLTDLPMLVSLACENLAARGDAHNIGTPATIKEATSAMLLVLHAICIAGENLELPVPAALLEISSINRLVDVASRIVSKHDRSVSQRQAAAEWRAWLSANIASEAREEAHARWRQWQEALFALGLVEEHLAVALSARSKAFMVFMDTAARYGSGRLSLRVQREASFTDSLRQARSMRLLDQVAGGMVIYPSFTETASPRAASAETSGRGLAPCRRQEFFEHAGRQMLQGGVSTSGSGDEKEQVPLFVRTRSGSNYWFNTELKQSEACKDEFRWAGWLMGQCFANRAMLCIPLPELLFVKLLKGSSFQATIELLSEFDAELAASVRGVANLRTKEYKQQLAAEGYPADFTRRSYMRYQIKKLLVTDVDWQFEALSQGFFAAVDRETLKFWRITAADLAELAAGMTESRPTWVPKARAADTEIKSDVQAHVASSDAPVVNTLWKHSPGAQVNITAQASLRSIAQAVFGH
ncbi:hypothetical protein WJX75_007069 [Coccomyxa subellipsoidea]|uniref:protein-serine/threonine phosphatase n=1 Tax=Coccomyxa subellipsoidea TaxID=248742 RepID=A0ABR2YWG6_9CHLO